MKLGFFIKSKYIKRTGSPGNYKYEYAGDKKGKVQLNNIDAEGIQKLKQDSEFLNSFMKNNQDFVRSTVNSLLSKIASHEDFMQEANVGFIEGVNRFNPKKSPKAFLSFIKNAMLYSMRSKIKKDLRKNIQMVSLEEERVPDPRVEKELETKEVKTLLDKISSKIKGEKAKKIFEYMLRGYKQEEISKMIKISEGRVSQIVKKEIRPIAQKYKNVFNKSMAFSKVMEMLNNLLEE